MQTRTSTFDLAVQYGAQVVQQLQVLRNGVSQSLPTTLNVLNGSKIGIDRRAAIRRTLSLKLADPLGQLVPKKSTDPMAPYGNEISVSVGFRYVSGVIEYMPQGVFAIETAEADTEGNLVVTGRDRASVISQALLEDPYAMTPSQDLGAAIQAALSARYPGTLAFNFVGTGLTVPATAKAYLEGTDIWQAMVDLAFTNGYELFFDANGTCVMQAIPNPVAGNVVWTYAPGPAAIVMSEQASLSSRNAVNVVVVIGEGGQIGSSGAATTPVKAKSVVSDATSPILPVAPFGRRPKIVTDSSIKTLVQAQAAADRLLLEVAGSGEVLGFTAAPHPSHDPGDVVRLTSTQLGLDTFLVLDAWDLDLGLKDSAKYATTGRRAS